MYDTSPDIKSIMKIMGIISVSTDDLVNQIVKVFRLENQTPKLDIDLDTITGYNPSKMVEEYLYQEIKVVKDADLIYPITLRVKFEDEPKPVIFKRKDTAWQKLIDSAS